MKIDLRSDTVTKPTEGMRDAMMNAELGDDVFGEDPSVNALEEMAAKMFGTEAALFCPSGTMTNQIAVKIHCSPMTQVIVEKTSHTYLYEGGGIAFNSAASVKLLDGDRGRLTADQITNAINPDDLHFPESRLVSLENTCNKGGGCYYDFEEFKKIKAVCDEHKLKLHLDGARLFNALIGSGDKAQEYGKVFDTISICLSKGLGAPVGSLLLGNKEDIRQGRRIRKVFGGGMRQAGFLAAAGSYALKHHIERLAEDHAQARKLADVVSKLPYITEVLPVETNIIVFQLKDEIVPEHFLSYLRDNQIFAVSFGGQLIRFVTHLDFKAEMIPRIQEVLQAYSH